MSNNITCPICSGITGPYARKVAQTLNNLGQSRYYVCPGHATETVYNRCVRIQSHPEKDKAVVGVGVSIVDAETGESIPNVFRIVITLDAEAINTAKITYHESDASGHLLVKDNDVVVRTVESVDPEVDITAVEVEQ